MGRYAVQLKPSADRALGRLPADVQRRIVLALEDLGEDPRPAGVKKLAGDENLWRIRVGACRVVYEIHERPPLVMVLRVAHRRDAYREK
jgi:mRNA interferase RelE/StbE